MHPSSDTSSGPTLDTEREAPEQRGDPTNAPRSARSRRTSDALVVAASELFRERGFTEVTITEIAHRAGMSHGTFYTHFDSKESIFRAVIAHLNETSLHHAGAVRRSDASLRSRIDRTNRAFVEVYRDSARLLSTYEELAARDDETAALRRRTRMDYIGRTAASIRSWQADGLVDVSIDAEAIAHCLGSMVERVAHMRYVFGDGVDDERMLDAISHVWAATLGLDRRT